MVALSFWKTTIYAVNNCFPVTLINPTTIGDHIRKRRLRLSMKQEDVGKIIGVSTDSITYWENNRTKPKIQFMPQIIKFLGYSPLILDLDTLGGRIKTYRIMHGLSHRRLGQLIGVDASTIGAWEQDQPISRKNQIRLLKIICRTSN